MCDFVFGVLCVIVLHYLASSECLFNVISVLFPGWVNELVGGQHSGAKGFMFFGVNVDLTENGIGITASVLY